MVFGVDGRGWRMASGGRAGWPADRYLLSYEEGQTLLQASHDNWTLDTHIYDDLNYRRTDSHRLSEGDACTALYKLMPLTLFSVIGRSGGTRGGA